MNILKNIKFAFAFAALTFGCAVTPSGADESERMSSCESMTDWDYGANYDVNPTEVTPSGIPVDRTGQTKPSLDLIDTVVSKVEACLIKNFPPNAQGVATIPEDVLAVSNCQHETFRLPIARGCWNVKIPDDWSVSCDGKNELLSLPAPNSGCESKGLTPTEACPCHWRAAIQGNTIIVTPSLYLLPDDLIRAVTSCGNPWASPKFSECAMPVTPALSSEQ